MEEQVRKNTIYRLNRLMVTNSYIPNIKVTLFIIFLIFLLNSVSWAAIYHVDATNGSDLNNGLSEASPWKTITKVNTSIFMSGDKILFKRGEIWRERLTVRSSGTFENPITFGAYGSGNKPRILGSVDLAATGSWAVANNTGGFKNLWQTTTPLPDDVGNLIFNGEASVGVKKSALNQLSIQGDFYYDIPSGYLYLCLTSNPGSYYTAIEAAVRGNIITIDGIDGGRFITVQDLDLRYAGSHGVGVSSYTNTVDHITIQRLNISWIGGSYLPGLGFTRFGNGIEFYDGGTNIVVQFCRIDQVYDSGITTQGIEDFKTYRNHLYAYNIISNCIHGWEFWALGVNSTTSNIHVLNNVFYNNGYGWGRYPVQRPDLNGNGFMLWKNEATTSNCFFQNNIILNSAQHHVYILQGATYFSEWTLDSNLYYPDRSDSFNYFGSLHNFTTWKNISNKDLNSILSDPKFVSIATLDFHLHPSSPCIDAGTSFGLSMDFDGNPILVATDIGALEYVDRSPKLPMGLRILK